MPTFIPPEMSKKTPWSERDVFQRLEADPVADDWTIYHSLGIGAHKKRPHGEIDFLITIPDLGIVTVEVKGGEVSCRDGIWQTVPHGSGKPEKLDRSPWMQARENAYALQSYLAKKLGNPGEYAFNYSHLVVLPSTATVPASSEYNAWEVATGEDLDDKGIGRCVLESLEQTIKTTGRTVGRSRLKPGVMRRIRKALRPDFDIVVSPSYVLREGESRLLQLTEEQYRLLDIAEANQRAIARGAAGTGKTLLALEFARREYLKGKRVGIFCYNKLLGDWLSQSTKAIVSQVVAEQHGGELVSGTVHGWLRSVIRKNSLYESEFLTDVKKPESRFDELLFHYGELALLESDEVFDTMIVDEIQDFIDYDILGVIDSSLKGGLSKGTWLFLGDFTRQSLFSSDISVDKSMPRH